MIYTSLRTMSAFVLGLVTAFGLIFGIEILSNVVHPFPSDFSGTQEEICMHVEKYPNWILAGVAMNIPMLPYSVWFKFLSVIAVPVAAMCGARLASQRQTLSSSVQHT